MNKTPSRPVRKAVRIFLGLLIGLVVCLVILPPSSLAFATYPWLLLTGWMSFPVRTLPQITAHWPTIVTGLLVIGLTLAAIHEAGRRWLQTWPPKTSLWCGGLLLSAFAVGTAWVGIWRHGLSLLGSDQPLVYVEAYPRSFPARLQHLLLEHKDQAPEGLAADLIEEDILVARPDIHWQLVHPKPPGLLHYTLIVRFPEARMTDNLAGITWAIQADEAIPLVGGLDRVWFDAYETGADPFAACHRQLEGHATEREQSDD